MSELLEWRERLESAPMPLILDRSRILPGVSFSVATTAICKSVRPRLG